MKHSQQLKYLPILFVLFIVTSLLLTACDGGQKTYTVGVVNFTPSLDGIVEGFKEGMTEFGYLEGENITYLYEGATGRIETLDSVAQGLVEADVDLILSITTPPTQAAQRATAGTDIPVVFVPVTDPVGAGIVDSLRNPGGNITGITFGIQETRRLEWLIQVVPTIEDIYIPYNPEDRSAVLALEMASAAAPELGVELITRGVRTPEEIMAAIEDIPEEADAIFFLPDSLMGVHAAKFVTLQLPTSAADPTSMKAFDMLTSYGIDITAAGKQAARLADQIFQGIKPTDLPIETAEFYLAINLKAAEAIGLDISDEILLQADIIVR
jgi:putative ABC transport system substrate-binding protein